MNRIRAVLVITLTVSAIGLAACHKKVPPAAITPTPAPPPARAATPPPPPPPPPPPVRRVDTPRPLTEQELFARKSLDQLNAEHPLDDAFFDLDKSDILADAQSALQKDAEWLKRWPTTQITIEGHCDERGSSEYNLGLGSRRATAAKDYLVNLGVAASRVLIVSKGKEQPFCADHDESCWHQNRRGHFIVTAK